MNYWGPSEVNAEEYLLLYEHRAISGTLYPGDVYNNMVAFKLIDEVTLKFSHILAKNQSFDDKITTTRVPIYKQSGVTGGVYTFVHEGVLYYLYNDNLSNLDTNNPSDIQKTALRDPETYGLILARHTRDGIRKKNDTQQCRIRHGCDSATHWL